MCDKFSSYSVVLSSHPVIYDSSVSDLWVKDERGRGKVTLK